MSVSRVYFDYASTTPVDDRVREAMMPFLHAQFGNASSLHQTGTSAKEALHRFRAQLASYIHAEPDEIIFTSGGTEANNLALKGIAFANQSKGDHIIVSSIEHDSILNSCKWLESQGFMISYLPVNNLGLVDLEILKQRINSKTILVSIIHANNEIATIQPLKAIGEICDQCLVPLHIDACQSFGKIPINVIADHVSLMTLNAHKIYGPKGAGALYVKKGIEIAPLMHGGGQESGLRSGTENLAGIAGFVKAAELCMLELEAQADRLSSFKRKLIDELENKIEGFYINGDPVNALPNILNFGISGIEGETIRLMLILDDNGIAVSAGSACSNNDTTKSASHVLKAIGKDPFAARGAIRLSFGRFTTLEEIDYFMNSLINSIQFLKPIFS